jgi:hypothetical protein
MPPSPTAAAQRLTEPEQTSPAAKDSRETGFAQAGFELKIYLDVFMHRGDRGGQSSLLLYQLAI